jgi:hypothetical protein
MKEHISEKTINFVKSWNLQLKVVSEANISEHWSKAHKRHKIQKRVIRYFMGDISLYKDIPVIIKLIRISPRKLDEKDNLPMSFKYVADAIADLIYPGLQPGRADDNDLMHWEYAQEKGAGSIRVELYKKGSE